MYHHPSGGATLVRVSVRRPRGAGRAGVPMRPAREPCLLGSSRDHDDLEAHSQFHNAPDIRLSASGRQ
eukprot:573577-Prymnesium_polylepis.1